MNKFSKKGFSFGLTSAVITTLGLITGLDSSTGSKIVVISGILTIALADSFSDALGMHMAVESEGNRRPVEIWKATSATFLTKLIFALSFLLPFLFLPLDWAWWLSILWGFTILIFVSYRVARQEKMKPREVITEHVLIAILVLILTYYLGRLIAYYI